MPKDKQSPREHIASRESMQQDHDLQAFNTFALGIRRQKHLFTPECGSQPCQLLMNISMQNTMKNKRDKGGKQLLL